MGYKEFPLLTRKLGVKKQGSRKFLKIIWALRIRGVVAVSTK
jgi:hypothetical protein